MKTKHVLLVGNDKTALQGIAGQLKEVGFESSLATTQQSALDKLREARPDAILMNINGEGVGEDLLRTLRAQGDYATSAPVIVLTQRGDEGEAVAAVEVGADDFLVKPVRSSELGARLQIAMLKGKAAEAPSRAVALRVGPIFLNVDRREVYMRLDNGEIRPISLTKREFALLRALMARKNVMMSRQQLVDEAFGEGTKINPSNLGAYIHRLREKVELNPSAPRFIVTDRGLGFKVVD
jgi:DNA-binding response OmpR family regulator